MQSKASIQFAREIARQIGAVTGRDPEAIDWEQPFVEMGIESLQAVNIIAGISEKLSVNLAATTMFDYPTVRRLADYLADPDAAAQGRSGAGESRRRQVSPEDFEPIAIVGMNCRFPGAASVEEFWKNLRDGKDSISKPPAQRWESSKAPAWGGFIDGVDQFDPEAFGISEPEALKMDPQQRILLECTWGAIESAGYTPAQLSGSRTGVFIGISSSDYSILSAQAGGAVDIYDTTGNAHSVASNRISYLFNLRGPSMSVDTACSSSLVSLHLACSSLRLNESDYAIAGGVNVILTPTISEAFAQAQMLSPDGRCKTFSDQANGYVRGEGVGVLVLRRLSDALRDRDPIWAVVRGTAVNQDARSSGLTAPNGPAQEEVIRTALDAAHIPVSEVGYIEAHGTGTPLGDPIEYLSLSRVIGERSAENAVRIGSVKTNIGHLEAAAGVAGIIKTVLALKNRWIPKSLHFERINPKIGDQCPNLNVVREGAPWTLKGSSRRLAGVSSFGFGGTNAHVVLQEFDGGMDRGRLAPIGPSTSRHLLCGSATDLPALKKLAQDYRDAIPSLPEERLQGFCVSSIETRMELPWKLVVHGTNASELDAALAAFVTDQKKDGWAAAKAARTSSQGGSRLAFVFSGGGAFAGMGRDLYDGFRSYRDAFDSCVEGFDRYLDRDLYTIIYGDKKSDLLLQSDYGQAAVFTFNYALARLFQETFAIEPSIILGQGVGEILAACVAGAVGLPGAIRLAAARGLLLRDKSVVDRAVADSFAEVASQSRFSMPELPLVSSLTGEIVAEVQMPAYWKRHLQDSAQFAKGLKTLTAQNPAAVLFIGPSPDAPEVGITRFVPAKNFHQSLAEMAVAGFWKPQVHGKTDREEARMLPHTVFAAKKFWAHHPRAAAAAGGATAVAAGPQVPVLSEQQVLEDLQDLVGRLLHVDPSTFNVDEPLVDMGADSLLLLNAIQSIKDKYQVTIAISDVFQELGTLRKIAAATASQLATMGASGGAAAAAPTTSATSAKPLTLLEPEPAREKKGVLGNFSSRANREPMKLEDDKKDRYLAELIKKFNAKTPKTKAHTEKYRAPLADNRVSAGFRPNLKEMVYPIVCHKAKGSRFVDFDGNEYIDFSMGFGVNLFGHSPDFIEKEVLKQIELGMAVGPQSDMAGPVAKKMADITGMERIAFLNSGTEAVMTALRLARAATGREKIVIFDGSYHGHFDGVLARAHSTGGIPVAPGVTRGFVSDVMVLDLGTPESLEKIRKHAHELAAVITEPVQSRYPEHQPAEFFKEVRAITERSGTAFIFDEVIMGFRVKPGGAQEHFGIRADIATYGKILGGGFPIGAIGGKAKFLDAIDGGKWQFGDNSFPQAEMTFFAGTFCKHPLAMAAANAVLDRIAKEGKTLLGDLNRRTQALCDELNGFFDSRGLDVRANCFGSLFRFKAAANLDLFFYNLNLRGAYVWEGRNLFLSTAHTEEDVRTFIRIVKDSTDELIANDILKKGTAPATTTSHTGQKDRALISPQERFRKLTSLGDDGEAASHICISVKMKGPLQIEALKGALQEVMKRHDAFRLRVDLKTGRQWFDQTVSDRMDFDQEELSTTDHPWKALDQRLKEEGRKSFALDRDIPVRFRLYQIGEENAVFSMVCHHIAVDGWSAARFIEDAAKAYRAQVSGTPADLPVSMQFAEFVDHPHRFGTEKKMESARKHWEERFPSAPAPIKLPGGKGGGMSPLSGQRVVIDFQKALYDQIKKAAQDWKVSPLMLMLAGFYKLLQEIDGQTEHTVGIPAANRDLDGADKMLGNCSNLLPIRMALQSGESTQDLLKRIKTELLASFQNMVHPYEEMEAKAGNKPLFNISFNLEPASELPDFDEVSLFVHPYPITASEFDLTFNITDLEYFYHVEADFRVTAATEEQVTKWIDRYAAILKDMTKP